jgi:hypothetical protein
VQFAGKQAIGDAMSKEARPGPGAYPLPASFGPQQQSQKANPSSWKFGTSTRCVPALTTLLQSRRVSCRLTTLLASWVGSRCWADGDAADTPSNAPELFSER